MSRLDVTQQTSVGEWRGCDGYDPEREFARGWVVGIARRRIADALVARSRIAVGAVGVTAPNVNDGPPATLVAHAVRTGIATEAHVGDGATRSRAAGDCDAHALPSVLRPGGRCVGAARRAR